jgi:lipoyl-dependent peroxiredoxin
VKIMSQNIVYTGKTHTTGGRDGASRSSDGELVIALSPPGSNRTGTNPEQLFAAGWSACFLGAIGKAACGCPPTPPSTPKSTSHSTMAASR